MDRLIDQYEQQSGAELDRILKRGTRSRVVGGTVLRRENEPYFVAATVGIEGGWDNGIVWLSMPAGFWRHLEYFFYDPPTADHRPRLRIAIMPNDLVMAESVAETIETLNARGELFEAERSGWERFAGALRMFYDD